MCTEVRVARCSSARSSGSTCPARPLPKESTSPRVPRALDRAEKSCFHTCSLPCVVLNVRFFQPSSRKCNINPSIESPGDRTRPGLPARLRAHLPARWNRTVTLHTLPHEALSSIAFSKDRPFVAPESSSPLPRRIAPLLRRSAATPPACSDPVVSHHFAGLLLVDPVRTFAAAHDPGIHRRFTRAYKTEVPVAAPKEATRFPRCVSALRSFPSADSSCRWTLWRHLAMRTVHAGRLSPPARSSPSLLLDLRRALKLVDPLVPKDP